MERRDMDGPSTLRHALDQADQAQEIARQALRHAESMSRQIWVLTGLTAVMVMLVGLAIAHQIFGE